MGKHKKSKSLMTHNENVNSCTRLKVSGEKEIEDALKEHVSTPRDVISEGETVPLDEMIPVLDKTAVPDREGSGVSAPASGAVPNENASYVTNESDFDNSRCARISEENEKLDVISAHQCEIPAEGDENKESGRRDEPPHKPKVPIKLLDFSIFIGLVILCSVFANAVINTPAYTLSFDFCDGSEIVTQTIEYGDEIKIPPVPARAGYTFVGWYTNESFTEEFDIAKVNGDTHAYARWMPDIVEVFYDADGGYFPSGAFSSDNFIYGEPYGSLPLPSKLGFTFDGWYKDGVKIENTSIVSVVAAHTLTAKWIEVAEE